MLIAELRVLVADDSRCHEMSDETLAQLEELLCEAERACTRARALRAARAELLAKGDLCPVCIERPREVVFSCGHRACGDCAARLDNCPECRRAIGDVRIRLYS